MDKENVIGVQWNTSHEERNHADFSEKWVQLKTTILNEISLTQQVKYHMISHI